MSLSGQTIIDQFNRLIDNHIEDTNYSIEAICHDMALSRSQLFRLIKVHTGLSPSRYIRQMRLKKAKELLETTDLRIVEIATQVGFDSPQTFSRFFVEDYGINPTEYRKNRLNGFENTVLKSEEHDIQLPEIKPVIAQKPSVVVFPKYTAIAWTLLAVLVLAVGVYFWRNVKSIEEATLSDNSIVILPFKSVGSAQASLLAEGIMDQVHASLTLLQNLKVISKNSSQLLKDSPKTIPQIATQLNVRYVLAGTATQVGECLSVSIELVKAADDQVIWTQSYEGQAKDAIVFINKVAQETTRALRPKLAQFNSEKATQKIATDKLEAYNEYLKGKQFMLARTQEKLEASIDRFDRAIAIDPKFADAYAYKAAAYHILGNSTFIEDQLSIRMAEQNALSAIQIDAQNGVAYAVLANVYRQQNKWEQALTTYKIALKYSPNDAQINYWYSISLRSVGEFDKAIEYSTKAISLDPLYPTILFGHIGNCSYAGKYELAQKSIEEGKALFPGYFILYYVTGFYYLNVGDYQAALKEFKTADSISPNTKSIESYIAYCQGKLGQLSLVKTYLASLTPTLDNYDGFAVAYAGLNDKEQCFHYLQLAAAQGHLPEYFKVSPLFQFLHRDKRFEALLQQFGLLHFKLNT